MAGASALRGSACLVSCDEGTGASGASSELSLLERRLTPASNRPVDEYLDSSSSLPATSDSPAVRRHVCVRSRSSSARTTSTRTRPSGMVGSTARYPMSTSTPTSIASHAGSPASTPPRSRLPSLWSTGASSPRRRRSSKRASTRSCGSRRATPRRRSERGSSPKREARSHAGSSISPLYTGQPLDLNIRPVLASVHLEACSWTTARRP